MLRIIQSDRNSTQSGSFRGNVIAADAATTQAAISENNNVAEPQISVLTGSETRDSEIVMSFEEFSILRDIKSLTGSGGDNNVILDLLESVENEDSTGEVDYQLVDVSFPESRDEDVELRFDPERIETIEVPSRVIDATEGVFGRNAAEGDITGTNIPLFSDIIREIQMEGEGTPIADLVDGAIMDDLLGGFEDKNTLNNPLDFITDIEIVDSLIGQDGILDLSSLFNEDLSDSIPILNILNGENIFDILNEDSVILDQELVSDLLSGLPLLGGGENGDLLGGLLGGEGADSDLLSGLPLLGGGENGDLLGDLLGGEGGEGGILGGLIGEEGEGGDLLSGLPLLGYEENGDLLGDLLSSDDREIDLLSGLPLLGENENGFDLTLSDVTELDFGNENLFETFEGDNILNDLLSGPQEEF